jgi:hypothetical protein
MDSGSRKTFSNLFSRQTTPKKNTPQTTVVSRGRTPTKHYFLSNQTPGEGPREVSSTCFIFIKCDTLLLHLARQDELHQGGREA